VESKTELLKQKIVQTVTDFIQTEGGISIGDLDFLFGASSVGRALSKMKLVSVEYSITEEDPVASTTSVPLHQQQ
jgi:hypothetical protein